jgi:hypothetical protein
VAAKKWWSFANYWSPISRKETLVYQRRGVEGLAGGFGGHARGGQLPQL